MNRIAVVAALLIPMAFATEQAGAQQLTVANIIYPIHKGIYPIEGRVKAFLFLTASFSATCRGGPHTLFWKFDSDPVKQITFFDQAVIQLTTRLKPNTHILDVRSDCGNVKKSAVQFEVRQ